MSDAIVLDNLTKYYGAQRVVHGLSLRVPTGCVYGLLGRNGAGKSTAIKMLMGMVRPDAGSARLLGHSAADLPPAVRARIAYLAEGHPLYGWMTIAEAVAFSRAFHPAWNDELLQQILDHFALSRRKKIRRLSRGQQAQVSLALAAAPEPELLVLDDPTLGLDTVARHDFLESFIQLIQRQGRTILFSSHVLGDVERVADRIGVMVDGVLRVDCPTDYFKQSLRLVALEFAGAAPESVACPGLVRSRLEGRQWRLVVVGYGPEHERLFDEWSPLWWEAIELNLEDAFIEYTRGSRRPFPVLSEGARHVESPVVERTA